MCILMYLKLKTQDTLGAAGGRREGNSGETTRKLLKTYIGFMSVSAEPRHERVALPPRRTAWHGRTAGRAMPPIFNPNPDRSDSDSEAALDLSEAEVLRLMA